MDITVGILIMVVTPIATGAFVFGVMRAQVNGMKKQVEKLCLSVTRVHERVDGHLEWHCGEPGNPKACIEEKKHSRFLKIPEKQT